ncbi:MAG: hypothetical protein JXB29_09190 [Sedimentisphaerales bacterium]|nr:hypothetical protein [Sedimentisphaerales bacterium]
MVIRSKKKPFTCLITGLIVAVVVCINGCGDFFAQKSSELQSEVLLGELRQVKENPNVENTLPELYTGPAKKLKVKDSIKLFYFTKHHSADELAKIVTNQFSKMTLNAEGNTLYVPYYAITPNSATNQLIVDCPSEQEADKVLEFLKMVDIPPIQVNIDCLILERFADVTTDWETTIKVENFLGEDITLGGKTDATTGELLPAFPGASLRESKRATFGLDVGYWRNRGVTGHEFRAVVDMLISKGYLKILMNPTLETINGQKAKIYSKDNVPIEKIVTAEGVAPYSITEYQWVIDSLEVTPHVFADGSIGLATIVTLGSRSKPEGVVQASIITERSVEVAENRIKPGDSLVIGGIRKTEERAVVRGVPFLKDIPLLGVLFSSKDFEEKSNEVIFILTPSISSGGIKYAEAIRKIKEKYAPPKYEAGLHEALTDPFGVSVYTDQVEQQAAEAEFERIKAEIEKAQALEEVGQIKEKLFTAAEQVLAERAKAAKAHSEAEIAKQQAEKAVAELQKAKENSEKETTQTNKQQIPENQGETQDTKEN